MPPRGHKGRPLQEPRPALDHPLNTARATVVIRALNEAAGIGRCLDSVLSQDVPLEVLVIDSGSTDATVAEAQRREGVRVHHMPHEEFTYGRSCNLGLELSSTPFVIFLSAHAYPVDGTWARHLLEPLADPSVAGTYGRQDPVPEQDPVNAEAQRHAFSVAPDGTTYAHFSNANSAVVRAAWEALRFDEGLAYAEDLVWARAQADRGQRVEYVYEAAVYHSHPESLRQVHRRHRAEGMAMFEVEGERAVGSYVSSWWEWSRRDAARLARRREFRWAAWAPLYYGARLSGDLRGRRAARRQGGGK